MASDAIPGDLVNADNELYIGAAFGAVMCLGIFFYNFWFYRILAACAGFGIGGGATIAIGLFAPIAVDYVLYVGAAGAVLGIFFMTSYMKTLVGLMYILCGGFMVASASSFFIEEASLSKSSPLWITNSLSINLRDPATLAAISCGLVCAGFGYYYSTKKNKDGADEDEENSPLLRKK
ncbi:unknown protein [Bathycoccus prasinos]|jgi:hypothetical protein|uniref:DUF4203 domain-containing protein n=1 Tax=Bathycoccus prasinos TaxID=41875 RepID=K8ECC6_9CHLO|nr:unknown protein [Bathycoccus prasinos]CCO15579.1 unknown protein [Bathycoccus prasinos]|eukprot:XP_007514142.1 unknown protein [Bathycoccus prasinos]